MMVSGSMKTWLLVALVLAPLSEASAMPGSLRCPGSNTVEMRECASQSLQQSEALLGQKLPKPQVEQWIQATRAVCERAHALHRDGTIYPLLLIGCNDRLNWALLQEFHGMEGQ